MTGTSPRESEFAFDPAAVMRRDVFRLRRLAGRDRQGFDAVLARSQAELAARLARQVRIDYPAELPITAHVEEIGRLLREHQVLVVAGETGSGKTTQLPKIALEAGFGRRGLIAHTQPRRLAARSVAARIADELGVQVGADVGFAVRFSDQTGPETLVKLVTDGLLLTEVRRDRYLEAYDVVIVDEAHERSLNIDYLLGYLKRILARRSDLKVIITSATIDVDAYARHFGGAPVVEVSGRGYPVSVRYAGDDRPLEERLLECLQDIETGPQGRARDVLVFQTGEREIFDTARLLRESLGDRWDIVPLYARLAARDQQRVFQPGGRRRVVLATNVAETSITVPNIGYVIDPGMVRISRYSYRSKLQRLPIEPISQASANQRMGRCGRIAPGVCYRLYEEADFEGRPAFTDPEIRRTNLAGVVLSMEAFGLGDPARFPFLDPPDPGAVRDARKLLEELGALADGAITEIGRTMARLPVDPRLARMLVAADRGRCLSELLVIASALAVQDPRERPLEKRGSADQAHAQHADPRSDFLALLNLWRFHEQARDDNSRAGLRRVLERNFLSPARIREWRDLHRQLLLATREMGMRSNAEPAGYTEIHQAILSGSLSLLGLHEERGSYLGPRNLRFRIFPGSGLSSRRPRWLMAGEIAETQRVYARCVAEVEPAWIEAAAGHLVKRQYSDPHWSARRGEVIVLESVSLYGLPLADKRRVSYTRIDPVHCRDLLIRDGLVAGAINRAPPFVEHNLRRVAELLDREARGRRRDLLIGEDGQAALYAQRLPAEVASAAQLEAWWRRAKPEQRNALFFSEADLTRSEADRPSEDDFPSSLFMRELELPLKYRFAPGEADDGISLRVPLGALPAVVAEALEWSVPGFFVAVCEQWLKSLPKRKRRLLAPVPDRVAQLAPLLLRPDRYRQGRLPVALAQAAQDLLGVRIDAEDWDRSRIEPHLLINVQVVDAGDRVVAEGRDVTALQARFAEEARSQVEQGAAGDIEQTALTRFPEVVTIAPSVTLSSPQGSVVAYPALVDQGDHVDLKVLASEREQRLANGRGFARLALLSLGQTARHLKKRAEREQTMGLHFAPLGTGRELQDELLRGAVWYCFFEGRPLPADADDFNRRMQSHRGDLTAIYESVLEALRQTLDRRFAVARLLDDLESPAYAAALADARGQLEALVPADVLSVTPRTHLDDLPRYLEGLLYRLEHLQGRVGRDQEMVVVIAGFSQRLARIGSVETLDPAQFHALRFAIEELRIALFAEPVGTRGKVSAKRLDRDFLAVERSLGLA